MKHRSFSLKLDWNEDHGEYILDIRWGEYQLEKLIPTPLSVDHNVGEFISQITREMSEEIEILKGELIQANYERMDDMK